MMERAQILSGWIGEPSSTGVGGLLRRLVLYTIAKMVNLPMSLLQTEQDKNLVSKSTVAAPTERQF